MNDRGEAMQVTGFDKIAEKISAATTVDLLTVRQFLRDYAGNESIRDLLNQLFFFLPGKKIQKGDHWVKNVVTTAKAPVKLSHLITTTEMYEEVSEVVLTIKSEVSAKTGDEGRQYAEGKLTGIITASYRTGIPVVIYLDQLVTTHTDQYDRISRRVIHMPNFKY